MSLNGYQVFSFNGEDWFDRVVFVDNNKPDDFLY